MVVYPRLDTISESTLANICNAIADSDGGETSTLVESFIADTRYAIGNGDGN